MSSKNEKIKGKTNENLKESDLRAVTGGTHFKPAVMPEKKPSLHLQRPNPGNEGAMEEFYKKKKELLDKGINVQS